MYTLTKILSLGLASLADSTQAALVEKQKRHAPQRGSSMKSHLIWHSPHHLALVCATLLLTTTLTAQAAPIRADVTGTSYACVSLSGSGTKCGTEWFEPMGNAPASPASKLFSSLADASGMFSSGPVPAPSFPGSVHAETSLSATATTGSVSASANASAMYTGPQHPNPAAPTYHGWANSSVNGRWFDTLTVFGGTLGSPVLVRMTVSLEDTINGGPNSPSPARWAQANAGLYAATETDPESGHELYFGTSVIDKETEPATLMTSDLEFWVEVGDSFEIYGVLGIIASVDITDADLFTSQYASVDAAHTMRGFFEIVNPLAGQTLGSESGWDYKLPLGPTIPGNNVPEPGTFGLVGLTLAGFAAIRRRSVRPLKT